MSYHKKFETKEFQIDDLVLMENQKNLKEREKKGKFEPNCLGPYVVIAKYGSGAYQLATPEGDPLDDPMNIMQLKIFYAWSLENLKLSKYQEKYKKMRKRS